MGRVDGLLARDDKAGKARIEYDLVGVAL